MSDTIGKIFMNRFTIKNILGSFNFTKKTSNMFPTPAKIINRRGLYGTRLSMYTMYHANIQYEKTKSNL